MLNTERLELCWLMPDDTRTVADRVDNAAHILPSNAIDERGGIAAPGIRDRMFHGRPDLVDNQSQVIGAGSRTTLNALQRCIHCAATGMTQNHDKTGAEYPGGKLDTPQLRR